MNKIEISKKIKLVGFLSMIPVSFGVNVKPKTNVASASKQSQKQKKGEYYINNKRITDVSSLLDEMATLEHYYSKIQVEEMFRKIEEIIREQASASAMSDQELNANLQAFEGTKNKMLVDLESNSVQTKNTILSKYRSSMEENEDVAMVVYLILLIRALQEEDKALYKKINHLVKEYVHRLHRTSLDSVAILIDMIMLVMIQSQKASADGEEKLKEIEKNVTAHNEMNAEAAVRILNSLKKLLKEHYTNEDAINTTKSNYCVINGKSYTIIQLIDHILKRLEVLKEKLNSKDDNTSNDLRIFLPLIDAYTLASANKDIK